MRPSSPPDYRLESARSRSVSPEPPQWESHEFPTHSARSRSRLQSTKLYEMLQVMLAELEVEIAERGEEMGDKERLRRERSCYETAASELIRQLRTENKTQAALVEKTMARAWELADEVMPALERYEREAERSRYDREAVHAEVEGAERASELLRERVARTEIALWTARRKAASSEVRFEEERARRLELESQVEALSGGKASAEKEVAELRESLQGAKWTIEELEQSSATNLLEIEHLTADLERLRAKAKADAEGRDEMQAEVEAAEAARREMAKKVDELRKHISLMEIEIAEIRGKLFEYEEKERKADDAADPGNRLRNVVRQTMDRAKADAKAAKDQLDTANALCRNLRDELDELKRQLEEARAAEAEAQRRIRALEANALSAKGELDNLRRQLAEDAAAAAEERSRLKAMAAAAEDALANDNEKAEALEGLRRAQARVAALEEQGREGGRIAARVFHLTHVMMGRSGGEDDGGAGVKGGGGRGKGGGGGRGGGEDVEGADAAPESPRGVLRLIESRMASIAREFKRVTDEAEAAKNAPVLEAAAAGFNPEAEAQLASARAELAAREAHIEQLRVEAEITRWVLCDEITFLEEELSGSGSDGAVAEMRRHFARELERAERLAYNRGCEDERAKSAKVLTTARLHASAARTSQERLKELVRQLADQVVLLQSQIRKSTAAAAASGRLSPAAMQPPPPLEGEATAGGGATLGSGVGSVGGLPFESELAGGVPTSAAARVNRTMAFIREEADSWQEASGINAAVEATQLELDDGGKAQQRREHELRERIKSLQEEQLAMGAELEELRSVVLSASSALGGAVAELPARELREVVKRQRHDAELLRLRSALEARELLAKVLLELGGAFDKETRWTRDRLVRHTQSVHDPRLIDSLHFEVNGLSKAVHKILRTSCRALRGRLLPATPEDPKNATKRGGTLRMDQLRWLQGCCGVLFPNCLVCVFDPSKQDETETNPWTLLESGAYSTLDQALAADAAAESKAGGGKGGGGGGDEVDEQHKAAASMQYLKMQALPKMPS